MEHGSSGISLVEIEAGDRTHSAHAGANGLTFDEQCPGRKHRVAHRTRAANLDGSHDRAVITDPASPARPSKQL